jgi:hypothetical protein
VFFRDNVTSTKQGADRYAQLWLTGHRSCRLPQLLTVLAAAYQSPPYPAHS